MSTCVPVPVGAVVVFEEVTLVVVFEEVTLVVVLTVLVDEAMVDDLEVEAEMDVVVAAEVVVLYLF